MRNLIALLVSLAVAACAELPVEHVLGTEGVPADQLAVVDISNGEVQLLEIDGKRDLANKVSYFYIHPGMHRLVFALHYDYCLPDSSDGAVSCLLDVMTSPVTRGACINVEPGTVYSFRVPDESLFKGNLRTRSEWKLSVYKRAVAEGSREQEIEPTCPQ